MTKIGTKIHKLNFSEKSVSPLKKGWKPLFSRIMGCLWRFFPKIQQLTAFNGRGWNESIPHRASAEAMMAALNHQQIINMSDPQSQPVKPNEFSIIIDHKEYKVSKPTMTGLEIRNIPNPPIGPGFDLWRVVPGGDDVKIGDADVVHLKPGMHFYSAPTTINPGSLSEST